MAQFMQKRNSNANVSPPLGIRSGVWLIIGGLLLTCVVLIAISRRPRGIAKVATTSTNDIAKSEVSHTRSRSRPARTSPTDTIILAEAQTPALQTSAAISNELNAAREMLMKLRQDYSDEHPEVRGQILAIQSLERSAGISGETLALAKARSELAKRRVNFTDQHPSIREQVYVIESLERSARANEPPDLAEAKAELERLRVGYTDSHPIIKEQLRKIIDLSKK